jgi:hypothetical protein
MPVNIPGIGADRHKSVVVPVSGTRPPTERLFRWDGEPAAMGRGILGLVGLAATLAFAIPLILLGLQELVEGRTTMGAAFLGVALLMILVEEYLTTPMDLPGKAADTVVGTVVKDPDEDDT